MSSEISIAARALGKAYAIFSRPQDRLKQMLWRGHRKYFEERWALRNVDIDVYRGETVGIVGRNGSGKSTLLHLLSGTVMPTTGELKINGRVAALLELGAGFNPEFTGRENVFLSASIQGMTQGEIVRRFDEIAEFAGIGDYIERPVKTYSSGMYARLAFAVAINVEPDILVIDEVLAVGDEAFQRKCFSRINQMKECGTTILFVSHSASTVLELCDRALLVDAGERLLFDLPRAVIAQYHRLLYCPAPALAGMREEVRRLDHHADRPEATELPETGYVAPKRGHAKQVAYYEPGLLPDTTVHYVPRGATIDSVQMLDLERNLVNMLICGEEYIFSYRVHFEQPAFRVRFAMLVKNVTGIELASLRSHADGKGLEIVDRDAAFSIEFRFRNIFRPGTYFMNAGVTALADGAETFLHRAVDIYMFKVLPDDLTYLYGIADISTEELCSISPEQQDAQAARLR